MTEQPAPEERAEEDQAGKERQESLWESFNRADMKLFVVTFAGTLAANVVTVMVVAVAIIFDRPVKRPTAPPVLDYVIIAIVSMIGLGVGRTLLHHKASRNRRLGVMSVAWAVTVGLMTLLVLLGHAVGVK